MNIRSKFGVKIVSLLLLLWIFNISHAQNKPLNQSGLLTIRLQQQAELMAQAFLKGDYQTFAKYTYPALVSAMGGESHMASTLSQTVTDMNAKGMSFSDITVDSPTNIVKSGNELQCTLQQHTTIRLASGRAVATSTIIAISKDNGKNWLFVDTSNKDLLAMRKALPNLSKAIVIPQQQKPVFYNF